MARGRFITLEGGEGAGKSTQLRFMAETLATYPMEVVRTREPGGSTGAEAIRALLVEGAEDRWDAKTEALLHAAARRDHLTRTVLPALARGAWVLSDRFADSTMAYQGHGHGLAFADLAGLHYFVCDGFQPDLTLILDLPVADGLARASSRGGGEDRYERMGVAFHDRLREGFLTIARDNPDRCVVLDARGDANAVRKRIEGVLAARFPELADLRP
ncbi:MAG: dTMP kinase [Rhodospirillum sp.]|nr:dTMP kinase [Rhodospirillum sp.]MCF8487711.1 dTMP kinase [Rhodospirillum sp.]MCF8502410.1 dTMP kinase [Rhodospirillum sp.]